MRQSLFSQLLLLQRDAVARAVNLHTEAKRQEKKKSTAVTLKGKNAHASMSYDSYFSQVKNISGRNHFKPSDTKTTVSCSRRDRRLIVFFDCLTQQ